MLPADLQQALDGVAKVSRLLVAVDFDGTLAPIVSDPADARPLPAAADVVVGLTEVPSTHVALISGRALSVLRELSAMPPAVHLVGSHGAEFDTGFAHAVDESLLARIVDELERIAADRPGVTVETKPASVALHVRNASAADGHAALGEARAAAQSWDAQLTEGKAVLEYAVISTDKGEAVDILRDRYDASAVVFLGDDVTDEKAFRRLCEPDIGIKVGDGDTLAGFRVASPEDVATTLEHLLRARRKWVG